MPFRTDLAMEQTEPHKNNLPAGVTVDDYTTGNLNINRVTIADQAGGDIIGKPPGDYVTIVAPPFSSASVLSDEDIENVAKEIAAMLPKEGLVLVVGLGNNDITPDAIGPRTVRQVLATRHITGELARQSGLEGLRPAAAVTPGVLGQTGIETSEIIRSIVKDIHPSAVIVVDALAARSTSRLGNTIQIANSGISPGSGVMNKRKELSLKTLKVPVVSIGIPTVVDATTLACDLLEDDQNAVDSRREQFEPRGEALMITPREIDVLIGHACKALSMAINKALQPELSLEDISFLAS
ncbi:GPR endopeptidase [Oscillospiraceae bacterium MB08-C2-2]|nr:GPR endopeptidase [Oscillospiraceae bacterium MB08-C2-2]